MFYINFIILAAFAAVSSQLYGQISLSLGEEIGQSSALVSSSTNKSKVLGSQLQGTYFFSPATSSNWQLGPTLALGERQYAARSYEHGVQDAHLQERYLALGLTVQTPFFHPALHTHITTKFGRSYVNVQQQISDAQYFRDESTEDLRGQFFALSAGATYAISPSFGVRSELAYSELTMSKETGHSFGEVYKYSKSGLTLSGDSRNSTSSASEPTWQVAPKIKHWSALIGMFVAIK